MNNRGKGRMDPKLDAASQNIWPSYTTQHMCNALSRNCLEWGNWLAETISFAQACIENTCISHEIEQIDAQESSHNIIHIRRAWNSPAFRMSRRELK
jgi:hypothetical protein